MADALPETGALSVAEAVAALSAPEPKEKQPPAAAADSPAPDKEDSPAEPAADDGNAPTDDGALAKDDAESEPEGDEPQPEPSLDAPKFWDADARKWFGELSRERQEYILKKEDERNQATSRALSEAAERRKTADGESIRWKAYADHLARILPEAAATFQDRWANVDWNAVVDQYGAGEALKLQNRMEAERAQVQELQNAQGQADREIRRRFTAEEAGKLATVAPDLADPKEGPARRGRVAKFLLDNGIPAERVSAVSAVEAGLAYDAMRWRDGLGTAKTLLGQPRKPAAPRQAPVKPTAPAQSPRTSTQARIALLNGKRELSIDEAVELATLKGSQAA